MANSSYEPDFRARIALGVLPWSGLKAAMISRRTPYLAGIFLVTAILVFVVPWYLPAGSVPSTSESYMAGFSNRAAQLFLALGAASLLFHRLVTGPAAGAGESLRSILKGEDGADLRRPFLIISGLVLVGTAALYSVLPYGYYGEMGYFDYHLGLLALHYRPYTDVDFVYGPAMLYVPWILAKVTGGALSPDGSYLLWLLFQWNLGLFLLWKVVSWIDLKPGGKLALFLVFGLLMVNPTMGLSYTPLRFLWPVYSVRLLDCCVRDRGFGHLYSQGITAFIMPLFAFFLSPEMGLAATISFVAYLVVHAIWNQKGHLIFAAFPLLAAGVFLWMFGTESLAACFSPSAAPLFPIFPAPYICIFCVAAMVVLSGLGLGFIRWPGAEKPLAAALALQAGLLVPAALGRCDAGHVFLDGLIINLLGFALLWKAVSTKPAMKWMLAVAVIAFAVPMLGGSISEYANQISSAWQRTKEIDREFANSEPNGVEWVRSVAGRDFVDIPFGKLPPLSPDLTKLLAYRKVGTPFRVEEDIEKFLMLTDRLQVLYQERAATPVQSARLLAEMEGMETVLLPKDKIVATLPIDLEKTAEARSSRLEKLFFFPVSIHAKNEPFRPDAEMVRYIFKHYSKVGEFRNYLICTRRKGS